MPTFELHRARDGREEKSRADQIRSEQIRSDQGTEDTVGEQIQLKMMN